MCLIGSLSTSKHGNCSVSAAPSGLGRCARRLRAVCLSFTAGDGPVIGDLLRQPRTIIKPIFPGQDSMCELSIHRWSVLLRWEIGRANTLICLSSEKRHHLVSGLVGSLPYFVLSQFSRSVVPDSLWPHGLQHAWLPCLSPTPGTCSDSCPSSWWCHPIIILCCPLLLLPSIFPNLRVFVLVRFLWLLWGRHKDPWDQVVPYSPKAGRTASPKDPGHLLRCCGNCW